MAERGTVEQLDGDQRMVRSGGDLGFLYHSCHDLNGSNAKMMKQKTKSMQYMNNNNKKRMGCPRAVKLRSPAIRQTICDKRNKRVREKRERVQFTPPNSSSAVRRSRVRREGFGALS